MWQARFTSEAVKSLERLHKPVAAQVVRKVQWLAANFGALTPEPLKGEWKGVYKLRVGDYRVLYTIDRQAQSLVIHLIGHRSEIYKSG